MTAPVVELEEVTPETPACPVWREQLREGARQRMRQQIAARRAAGVPLFTDEQVAVLHQQLRKRRAKIAQ